MLSAQMSRNLMELDRLVNDPNVLLDAARVWNLLDELAGDAAAMTPDIAAEPPPSDTSCQH